MNHLVGWLLQTEPSKRPDINQVLTHPAIVQKVRELEILYPTPSSIKTKSSSGLGPNKPMLPVTKRKSVLIQKFDVAQPQLNHQINNPNKLITPINNSIGGAQNIKIKSKPQSDGRQVNGSNLPSNLVLQSKF